MSTKVIFLLILSSFLVIFSSCEQELFDLCKNTDCQNEGYCESGECFCPAWYEGQYCESLMRDKFIDAFRGTFIGSDGTREEDFVIRFEPMIGKINEFSSGNGAIGYRLQNNNTFSIPFQLVDCGLLGSISGEGNLSEDRLNIRFTITCDGNIADFQFRGTRI